MVTTDNSPISNTHAHVLQEFDRCKEEFDNKYELYFRLHQLLQTCRRDFEAWKAALHSPGLDEAGHARCGVGRDMFSRQRDGVLIGVWSPQEEPLSRSYSDAGCEVRVWQPRQGTGA